MKGLNQLRFQKRLRKLGLWLGEEKAQSGIKVYKYLKGGCKGNGDRLFPVDLWTRQDGVGRDENTGGFSNMMKPSYFEDD